MNYATGIALITYFNSYHDAIVSVKSDRTPLVVIKELCEVYKYYTQAANGKIIYLLPNNKIYIYDECGKIINMYMLRLQAHDFFMRHWREQYAKLVLSMSKEEFYKYQWGSSSGYGGKEKEANG